MPTPLHSLAILVGALLVAPGATRATATPAALPAGQSYSPPRFTTTDRHAKLTAFLPEIDREFRASAQKKNYPGLVWGLVLDGELIHTGALGYANVERKTAAAGDTRFRIASMTKSFTAMAVLRLRDAGKLRLDDPVGTYLPNFRRTAPLTADAAPITIRHLLTMGAGFPEDNPWGDRQLAVSVAQLQDFLRDGLSLSQAPGVEFEYSNLGYALLGQIITEVAGQAYQRFITREILQPLGMNDTVWEYTEVPADKLALGYRNTPAGWQPEPLLHDGTYGAMGGLLTTMNDFARYVAFHLDAWPPRDDPETGPVRRSTIREMHQPAMFTGIAPDAKSLSGEPLPLVSGYGYGLSWTTDGNNVVRVSHSGGLPGFGSNYRFYPEHGFAVISFANLTYAGTGGANAKAGAILIEKANLPRRTLPVPPILELRRRQITDLIQSWDPQLAAAVVAENFFLDRPRSEWIEHSREVLAQAGAIQSSGDVVPANQLRGTFPLIGTQGRIEVFFTLTPERTPRVQQLRLTFVPAP